MDVVQKMPLGAKVLKLRYQLWLVLLREVSILLYLMNNFDKVRKEDTLTYNLVKLLNRSSFLKKKISALDRRLRKRIY